MKRLITVFVVVLIAAVVIGAVLLHHREERQKRQQAVISEILAGLPAIPKEKVREETFVWSRGECVLFCLRFGDPDGKSEFGLTTRLHDLSYSVDLAKRRFTIHGVVFGKAELAKVGYRTEIIPNDYGLIPRDSIGVISKMKYSRLHDQTRLSVVFRLK